MRSTNVKPLRRGMASSTVVWVLLLCGSLMFLMSCVKKGSATVSCQHIDKLQTGLGLLNTPNLLLGNVIEIDPSINHASHKDKVDLQDGDAPVTPGDETTNISSSSSLDIKFSANVPSTVTAGLTSGLSDSMQLQLTGSVRHQIDHPDPVLNRSANVTRLLDDLKNAPAGHRFLLVVAGNAAQSVNFTLKNGTNNKLTVDVPGTGKFELDVDYQCQGDLTKKISEKNAQGMMSFFKVVEILKNSDGSLSTTTFNGNLGDYDLTNTFK
jgi:hypothetical protein